MKNYSNKISLIKNSRGIYCIDTSMGCSSGMANESGGCYGDCYAAKSAKQYGFDFSKTILRYFENKSHERQIISQINNVKLDFIRIGCSGDPSENWEHCIDILKIIQRANKQIVIITKHWTNLTDMHLQFLKTINVCINTSVSALDKPELLQNSIEQYGRIKQYCRSVLRIVSCDFNLQNPAGKTLSQLQDNLFKNEDILDTVFRPGKNNRLVLDVIVNVKKGLFNGSTQLLSKFSRKTYTGNCTNCHQMCGVKMLNDNYTYGDKRFIPIQQTLF